MAFVEKNSDKEDCFNEILRTAPEWVVSEISQRSVERGGRPLPFKGVPNTEGTPEQLDATKHALLLRKLELLREQRNEVR